VTGDIMTVVEDDLEPEIVQAKLADGLPAYQLARLQKIGEVIRSSTERRLKGARLAITADWRKLLDVGLGPIDPNDKDRETRARQEKAAALKELAEARFSILIGPAGTGKTTLLSVLCSHKEIEAGGVLLLAPTGKARVRMEQAAKDKKLRLEGLTVA
jgi:hypothetical protein